MPIELRTTKTLLDEGEKTLSSKIKVIIPTTGIVKTMTLDTVFHGSSLNLKKISQTIVAYKPRIIASIIISRYFRHPRYRAVCIYRFRTRAYT